jgi:hypothetical protein
MSPRQFGLGLDSSSHGFHGPERVRVGAKVTHRISYRLPPGPYALAAQGTQRLPFITSVLDRVEGVLPRVERRVLQDVGQLAQLTDPDRYAEELRPSLEILINVADRPALRPSKSS